MEEAAVRTSNNGVSDDDDDPPMLSSHALAALNEFLHQQNQSILVDQTEESRGETEQKVDLVAEDWRLSQFWYDPLTAETVAKEVIALLLTNNNDSNTNNTNPSAACIACPTLYAHIKKIEPNVCVQLLEYDKRFEQYGNEFTFYDYNQPEELPSEFKHAYQVVVADPPYLIIIQVEWNPHTKSSQNLLGDLLSSYKSKECLEKVTQTIAFLAKPRNSYLLLLTGEVQKDRAAELLGLHPCGFRPQHSSKLGNEFRLFTNYDPGVRLGGWQVEK